MSNPYIHIAYLNRALRIAANEVAGTTGVDTDTLIARWTKEARSKASAGAKQGPAPKTGSNKISRGRDEDMRD